jgi:hypothetical protein
MAGNRSARHGPAWRDADAMPVPRPSAPPAARPPARPAALPPHTASSTAARAAIAPTARPPAKRRPAGPGPRNPGFPRLRAREGAAACGCPGAGARRARVIGRRPARPPTDAEGCVALRAVGCARARVPIPGEGVLRSLPSSGRPRRRAAADAAACPRAARRPHAPATCGEACAGRRVGTGVEGASARAPDTALMRSRAAAAAAVCIGVGGLG